MELYNDSFLNMYPHQGHVAVHIYMEAFKYMNVYIMFIGFDKWNSGRLTIIKQENRSKGKRICGSSLSGRVSSPLSP